MKKMGTHLLVDAWDVPSIILNDAEQIRRALIKAVAAGEATLIDLCLHKFSPHGVTATATLAESHIAIHTWPEYGYLAADLFFCGVGKPLLAIQVLKQELQVVKVKVQTIERGIPHPQVAQKLEHKSLENSNLEHTNLETAPVREKLLRGRLKSYFSKFNFLILPPDPQIWWRKIFKSPKFGGFRGR